jgi:hypothetical protein
MASSSAWSRAGCSPSRSTSYSYQLCWCVGQLPGDARERRLREPADHPVAPTERTPWIPRTASSRELAGIGIPPSSGATYAITNTHSSTWEGRDRYPLTGQKHTGDERYEVEGTRIEWAGNGWVNV